jgi:murein L,D-transpeptidase YcbB/YkuD
VKNILRTIKAKGLRTGITCTAIFFAIYMFAPAVSFGFENLTGIDKEVSRVLSDNLQTPESASGLNLQQPELVSKFYTRIGFKPAWTKNAKALPVANELSKALRRSFIEGLDPGYYNLADIEVGIRNLDEAVGNGGQLTPERIAWIEILMSDAYFAYASDLITGRVKPRMVVEDARIEAIRMELSGFLMRMLRVGWVQDSLESLSPANVEYQRLKKALTVYREALGSGGWRSITTQMVRGDKGIGVLALRKRLRATGDLFEPATRIGERLFDIGLEHSVKSFQRRHGLDADGMVGPVTLKFLNIPVRMRIRALELNMERLRWLPREVKENYLLVNLADFTLKVVKDGRKELDMRVIIGKDFQSTPSFSAKMTSLILNPYWNIPESIATNEIVPKLNENPSYLEEQGIEILRGWDNAEEVIDPKDIDLASIADPREGFRIRQRPGPLNPLGQIKFLMPNRFDIYLHDTQAEYLFEREVRTFSHGCIRVENPLKLATYAMRNSRRWTSTRLQAAIESNKLFELNLPEPMDVMILYQTAWADRNGHASFRKDIYGRDKVLSEQLKDTLRIPASKEPPQTGK